MSKLVLENEDGVEVEIPTRFEVCDRCEGKGVHDHPAFANGITADEWNGPEWDDEGREDYLRGAYDVPCEECDGLRVVPVPDESRMTDEHRALVADHDAYRAELAQEARLRARGIEF